MMEIMKQNKESVSRGVEGSGVEWNGVEWSWGRWDEERKNQGKKEWEGRKVYMNTYR